MYRLLFSLVLRRVPAETAHRVSFGLLRAICAVPGVRGLLRGWLVPRDPELRVRALGMDLPSPLGLAAGFDKEGTGADALGALGFGFVEIGTITGQPQPGNQQPRLFRLVEDRAIVNRMGFNNHGAAATARALTTRPRSGRVGLGVNIGKTKVVPEAEAVADYRRGAELLARHADYVVVNVSSPNTPGLRNLQAVELLRPLLTEVRAALDEAVAHRVPLLVKIAPDLADEDVDAVADLALELGLDGVIATNTTTGRAGLRSGDAEVAAVGAGGLSGAPLRERSLAVLRRLRARVGDRVLLVSVGGVESAEDVWTRIRAGATLVQAYTGFIYGGPFWPRAVHRDLARRVRQAGLRTVAEAVGLDAPTTSPDRDDRRRDGSSPG